MTAPNPYELSSVDPWWDLYMPAMFGELAAVTEALQLAEATVPLARRGDLYAVAARAYTVLGRLIEAERLVEQAIRLGGAEAEALATFVRPGGARLAEERAASGRVGARADALCDRAALRIVERDLAGARAEIARAEALCPGHAEAGRWARFLDETPDPAKAVRAASDPRRARRATAGPTLEAVELLPTRRTGWLSTERYRRRVLGTPSGGGWASPLCGLGRLHDVGVSTCFFALDAEYGRVAADHPLVELEVRADALRSRVEEGRDGNAAAWSLWEDAVAVDEHAASDASQLVVGLATWDGRMAGAGLDAVGWLLANRPDGRDLWDGYLCWLLHLEDRCGAGRARALLARRPASPIAWRMAIETLRAEDAEDEAEALVRAALLDPTLAGVARDLAEQPRSGPFRMIVSGRLAPRWGRFPGGG